jgi:hypothetical protein
VIFSCSRLILAASLASLLVGCGIPRDITGTYEGREAYAFQKLVIRKDLTFTYCRTADTCRTHKYFIADRNEGVYLFDDFFEKETTMAVYFESCNFNPCTYFDYPLAEGNFTRVSGQQ